MSTPIHEAASKGFEIAADAYERGRPDYPQDAVDDLINEIGFSSEKTILDLGAGTGKFTRLIANRGANIVAVEPVAGMRQKFSQLLPSISIQAGTAESLPLANASVDSVVVAQAFHWFSGEKSLTEIARVLKPGGKLAMIWNVRDESIDWVAKLTEIVDQHEKGAPRYKTGQWKVAFAHSRLFSPLVEKTFYYVQKGNLSVVLDRVASTSFISALAPALKDSVLEEVKELLRTHPQTKGRQEFEIPYRTDVFTCSQLTN